MDRLEELRAKAVAPTVDIKDLTSKMVHQSQQIHAAFLFEKNGWALRKKLCLMLSGTKPSVRYAGWGDFAAELGLDGYLIKVMLKIVYKQIKINLKFCSKKIKRKTH